MSPLKSTLARSRNRRKTSERGFTLGELLIVILIISVLLVVIVPQLGQGSSLSTSLAVMEASFTEARAKAVGAGTRSRIVIYDNAADKDYPERHLRYIAIAVEETDEDGIGTGNWIANDSFGEFLSPGVFFDFEGSKRISDFVESSNPPTSDSASETGFGTWKKGSIDFPGPPESEQPCYYFEFNKEGICIHDDSTTPGAAIVLSRGNRPLNGDPILSDSEKAGFLVLRNGGTSIFRDITALAN